MPRNSRPFPSLKSEMSFGGENFVLNGVVEKKVDVSRGTFV